MSNYNLTVYLSLSIFLIIIILSFNKIINNNSKSLNTKNSIAVEGVFIENALANSIFLYLYQNIHYILSLATENNPLFKPKVNEDLLLKITFTEDGKYDYDNFVSSVNTYMDIEYSDIKETTVQIADSDYASWFLDTYFLLKGWPYIFFLMLVSLWVIIMVINPANLKESSLIITLNYLGLIFMCTSANIIGFYLGLELYSLSSYVLASGCEFIYANNEIEKSESGANLKISSVSASLKYFILSAITSSLFLLGVVLNKGLLIFN